MMFLYRKHAKLNDFFNLCAKVSNDTYNETDGAKNRI